MIALKGRHLALSWLFFRTADYTFVHRQLTSDLIKRQVLANIGATINQITNADLRAFTIPFPTRKDERDVIAATLSDIDNLITCLGSMADKKRDLKQAAMQQLLAGQIRLRGFSGEWDTPLLGDLFTFKNGLNKAKEFFVLRNSHRQLHGCLWEARHYCLPISKGEFL